MLAKHKSGVQRLMIFSFCSVLCLSLVGLADCPLADLSGDCIVDMGDLVIFADDWLSFESSVHPDLVARWRFDETMGEIAADDVSGLDGQLYGDPQWMPAEGYQQGALFFDGVDDYVQIPGYKGITGSASRTCSAWIQTEQNSLQILSWGSTDAGAKWVIRINEDGTLRTEVSGGFVYGVTNLVDGEWHHIAVTLEEDATPNISDAVLYVDGKAETFASVGPFAIHTASADDVKIGVYAAGLRYFNGFIDDVHVYNTALSTDDILRLYQFGSALRHSPDFTADNQVNIDDFGAIAQLWDTQEPSVIISEFLASNDAENPPVTEEGQIRDGDGQSSDWIEIYNQTDSPIDLAGWGLSDDADDLFQWQFPPDSILDGRSYRLLFASGQDDDADPYVDPAGYLHTNFKLSASGEYLALTRPDGTVEFAYDSVLGGFPEQEENISYGMLYEDEYYFSLPTPGKGNREQFLGFVDAPTFSHERGFYTSSFSLSLTSETEDAVIRYTTDGTDPSLSNGITYTDPFPVTVPGWASSLCVRAAAFKPGYTPSEIKTKTYLLNPTAAMMGLPAVCLSGSPTETFFNPNGIMAIVGGAWTDGPDGYWYKVNLLDYNNVLGHGMNFERPASMEYMNQALGVEFQEDCGIRVHGSAWMRPRYLPASSGMWYRHGKYSFRLYFRGIYGNGKLEQPILEQYPHVDQMDTVVLRAGHNDQTNPFVRDEMIRRLQYHTGHDASLGTFVNLFINGSYKGYYNLCERIDEDFCQKYFDSNKEWDVVGWVQPDNVLEARDGDMVAFKAFINYARSNNLSNAVHYNEVVRQLDLEEFVDYIIVQCWGGNWDWPQNNWTAVGERSQDRRWRFFVWDAEGCMDGDLYRNRFDTLNSDGSDLSRLYRALKVNEDFRLLFADRLQKHFLESDSVMRKEFLTSLFWQLADEVKGVIPSINTWIPGTYIPERETVFFNQCINESLFPFPGPRFFLNSREIEKQTSGNVNSVLTFQNAPGFGGDVYYTLDGTDPRIPVSSPAVTTTLVGENAPKRVLIPTSDIGTNWCSKLNYNDSGWNAGLPADNSKTGGVGYERDAVGNKAYISYDVENEMYNQRTSAYIRIPFTVDPEAMSSWNYLTLSMRYDDGFVAYINGTEVCRREFTGTPAWNSNASGLHEGDNLETISLNAYLSTLLPGNNILAIHGLNYNTTSSDFVISPILTAGYTTGGVRISPTAQKYTSPVALTKSAHIKARTLNSGVWSPVREADVLIGFVNESLRISEILYHPAADPNEEFIELINAGTDPINLNQVRFTEGVEFTFGNTVLDPGQFLLLVRNQSVFENRYGTGLPVAGQYEGAIDNAGEKLKLTDILGNSIQELTFEDDWYEITDGDGFSLNAVDPGYKRSIPITPGPAAHWTFDEDSGTAVLDETGAHPGTIFNMQDTSRVPGRESRALNFDGVNDYVEATGYKGITGTASRTCAAWIKTIKPSSQIINWGANDPGTKWALRINEDGTLRAEVSGGYLAGVTNLCDGQWHHVATVLADDGSPNINETKLYVDGQPEPIGSSAAYSVNTAAAENVKIGVNIIGTVFFEGLIDEVRIYDRALTSAEISLLAESLSWSQKELWRPSAIRGGTPGRDETLQEQLPLPGSVVINEVLSHSHAASPDWLELYNTTNEDIAIGGWYISDAFDSDENRKKYRIPAGVVLTTANPYYVVDENSFNNAGAPGCIIPFAFSEGGETVYLQSGTGENLTGYFTKEAFDAAETGVSFGRFEKSTGSWNFVPMQEQTPGAANAYPKVGPIIMTEIMYHPGPDDADKDCEYIELMNISDQPVLMASYVSTYTGPDTHYEEWVPWRLDNGITFEFPADWVVDPGERMLLVKDLAAFNGKYSGVPAGTIVRQWTSGSLDNAGEKLQLSMPGDQEFGEDRYFIRHDRVNYDDEGDWPQGADGTGQGLTHIRPTEVNNNYTNDPASWIAADPTPGW
jgi:hypothetical protein